MAPQKLEFREVSLAVSEHEDDVVLVFSQSIRKAFLTTDEARKYALQMIERADEIDKRKTTESGIDTGNILPSR